MASSGLSAVLRRDEAVARRRPDEVPPAPGLANIVELPCGVSPIAQRFCVLLATAVCSKQQSSSVAEISFSFFPF